MGSSSRKSPFGGERDSRGRKTEAAISMSEVGQGGVPRWTGTKGDAARESAGPPERRRRGGG